MTDIKNKRVKFFETNKDSKYKDLAKQNENVVFFDADTDPKYFSIKLNGREYSGTQLIKDTQKILQDNINTKQNILVDHKNIKTINNKTILLDEKAPKDVNLTTADIGGVYHYESADNQDINGPKTFNKFTKFKNGTQFDNTTIFNGLATVSQQLDVSESKKAPFKLDEKAKNFMVQHLNVEYLGGKNLQTIESDYNKVVKTLSDKLYNIQVITEEEYNKLEIKDPSILYFAYEED